MKSLLLVSAAIAGLFTASAIAAPAEGGPGGRLFKAFDLDGNGTITRAEVDTGIDAQFAKIDTNGDKFLSEEEMEAFHEARRAEWQAAHPDTAKDGKMQAGPDGSGARRMGSPVQRLDWNLDGKVSLEEYAPQIRMMAMRLDRDGDGSITAEEAKPRGHKGMRGDKDGE